MNWFKHEYCASFDERMSQLINKEGSKGYGTYWYIIEMLCPQSEAKTDFNFLNNIKRKGFSLTYMTRIITKYGLFVVEGSKFWPIISYRMSGQKNGIPASDYPTPAATSSREHAAPAQRKEKDREAIKEDAPDYRKPEQEKVTPSKEDTGLKNRETNEETDGETSEYSSGSEQVFIENPTKSEQVFDENRTKNGVGIAPYPANRSNDNTLNIRQSRRNSPPRSLTHVHARERTEKRRKEKIKITTAEKEEEKEKTSVTAVAATDQFSSNKTLAGKIRQSRSKPPYFACQHTTNKSTFFVPKSNDLPASERPWQELVDELQTDSSWVELACLKCGYGKLLQHYFKEAVEEFRKHIVLYDKGCELRRRKDVRQYFVNFIASGKYTSNALNAYLLQLEAQRQDTEKYIYRYEQRFDGKRFYLGGQPIPEGAPPRPKEDSIWSEEAHKWVSIYATGKNALQ